VAKACHTACVCHNLYDKLKFVAYKKNLTSKTDERIFELKLETEQRIRGL